MYLNKMDKKQINLYYKEIFDRNLNKIETAKYVIFRPEDNNGWGNKLRGLSAAFSLSLLLDRILIVEDPYILAFFNSPEGIKWKKNDFFNEKEYPSIPVRFEVFLRPDNWNQQKNDDLAQKDFRSDYTAQFIYHNEGTSFEDAIFQNPHFKEKWMECFENYNSKKSRQGELSQYLLSNPKSSFRKSAVNKLNKMFDGNIPDYIIAVQFRTFFDIGSPNMPFLDKFLDEARRFIDNFIKENPQIKPGLFITSDSIEAMSIIENKFPELLSGKGARKIIHTTARPFTFPDFIWNLLSWFPKKVIFKLLRLIFKSTPDIQPKEKRYSERIIYRHSLESLIDWYILGECQMIISTYTTFVIYAAARTGNHQILYRIDIPGKKIGLIE